MSEEVEFSEIGHAGGKVELRRLPSGQYSIKYIHQGGRGRVVMQQACVSPEGRLLDTVSFAGMGQAPTYPQPSTLTYLISDEKGFFGKSCPRCTLYFRTDYSGRHIYCPYCGLREHTLAFTTKNQKEFMMAYCNLVIETTQKGEETTIDIDDLTKKLSQNEKNPWVYKEELQQSQSTCTNCETTVDILGDYCVCPKCKMHNCKSVYNSNITKFESEFNKANENLTDRPDREEAWEKLLRCVSDFEGLANELRNNLLRYRLHPKRRSDLSSLSFQRIQKSNSCILNWYGFEILDTIDEDDRTFLNKMFNRRHLFTHKSGIVDQEYIDNTGDTTVRLNQKIRLRSKEVSRVIKLVRIAGNNFIDGYLSFS